MPAVRSHRLKMMMEKAGLKQYQLAAQAGVSSGHISHLLHGNVDSVGSTILLKLAMVLNTNVDYLVGASDDPRPPHTQPVKPLNPDEEELIRLYRQFQTPYYRDRTLREVEFLLQDERQNSRALGQGSRPSVGQETPLPQETGAVGE